MTVTNRYGDKIRPGQVWADNDRRCEGRTVRVDSVDASFAECTVLTAVGGGTPKIRKVRLLLDRLHPVSGGYRLIQDSEEND